MVQVENATQTDCFTPEEVAEQLQVSRATVLFWLRMGRLNGSKLGYGTWRITPPEIEAFLERQAVGAVAQQQEDRDFL
jgi:excisionase family DNA binding protein